MKSLNMTQIYKNYKGKWVAIENFETNPLVIASGITLKEALDKARKKGYKHPAVTQIPKEVLPIVGII